MKLIHVAVLTLTLFAWHREARASDWSYCVAPADADRRIYVSLPFPAIGPRAEADFETALEQRRLLHDAVECTRTNDEATAIAMRQHAIEVNRQWGRAVIDTHWRPVP